MVATAPHFLFFVDYMEEDDIPDTFKIMPSWRVDDLLVGTATFDVEDVILALHPVYVDEKEFSDHPDVRARIDLQKQVLRKTGMNKPEGVLVDVIHSLAQADSKFLARFVLFVTGYDYLPVQVPIKVEFNFKDMPTNKWRPMAHTCEHVLKFPGLAYNADKEHIQENLLLAMDSFTDNTNSFTMV